MLLQKIFKVLTVADAFILTVILRLTVLSLKCAEIHACMILWLISHSFKACTPSVLPPPPPQLSAARCMFLQITKLYLRACSNSTNPA